MASLTYHACDLPQPEMTLIPLIVITTIVEIAFFAIRVWVMRKKGHSRGLDDISIIIPFVSAAFDTRETRSCPIERQIADDEACNNC